VRTVHLDGCAEVEAAYYSTPPGWIGQRVHVQLTDLHVLLDPKTGQLQREHVRVPRGHRRITETDRSARTPASAVALLARCPTRRHWSRSTTGNCGFAPSANCRFELSSEDRSVSHTNDRIVEAVVSRRRCRSIRR
jgi:hypothetical protein